MTPNADVRIAGVSVGKVISVKRARRGADVLRRDGRGLRARPEGHAGDRALQVAARRGVRGADARARRTPPSLPENGTLDRAQPRQRPAGRRGAGRLRRADPPRLHPVPARHGEGARRALGRRQRRARQPRARPPRPPPTCSTSLDKQKGSLQTLIRDSGAALRAIGVAPGRPAVADPRRQPGLRRHRRAQNESLTETVKAFPPFLRETRAALRDIDVVALEARPTLRALRPADPAAAARPASPAPASRPSCAAPSTPWARPSPPPRRGPAEPHPHPPDGPPGRSRRSTSPAAS